MTSNQLLALIKKNGVAVVDEFLDDSQVDLLISTCRKFYEHGQHDQHMVKSGIKCTASPGSNNYVLSFRPINVGSAANVLGLKPISDVFFSALIAELSKRYLGWNWNSHSIVFDDREFENQLVGTWHCDNTDDSRTCLKFYIYLSDTPLGHGEFQYVQRSHILTKHITTTLANTHDLKKLLHDMEAFVEQINKLESNSSQFNQLVGAKATVLDDIRGLSKSPTCDTNKFSYPGKRGTLIVFDSHGFHRGGSSVSGRRIVLRSHHLANPTFSSLWNTKVTTVRTIRRLTNQSSVNSFFW